MDWRACCFRGDEMAWLIEREYGDAMVFAGVVGLAGIVGYVLLERHGRARWRLIPLRELRVDIPYRNVSAITEYRVHAPLSVRVAAIASMALSTTGVATLFVAIPRLHFEGLAVSLVAAALMAVFCGGCGVATVAPSKTQLEMMRLATVGSVFLYAGLLFMSGLHGFSNGAAWADIVTVRAAVVLAGCGLVHAALLSSVVRSHRGAFDIASGSGNSNA